MTTAEPTPKRFNRDEYYRMGEIGIFDGERVELIQGEIFVKYPKIAPTSVTGDYQAGSLAVGEPAVRRFSREEYFRMADIGIFDNQRVERLEGEIIEMSPQHEPHARAIMQLNEFFTPQLKSPYKLRCQMPLSIGNSDPEPDITIITLPLPKTDAPNSAALVIEVADSSLALDRKKSHLYASANLPEYWIINLIDQRIERYTDPIPDPLSPTGAKYRTLANLNISESIQPLRLPLHPLSISELLES